MMKFFAVFTLDERFLIDTELIKANSKGEVTMCEVLDKYINQGIEQGKAEGEYETLYNLSFKKLLTLEQAEASATNKSAFPDCSPRCYQREVP